jgi:hypothetical protein
MNENNDCRYMLNVDIKNYVTISRNIPQDTKENTIRKHYSKYTVLIHEKNIIKYLIKLQGKLII